MNKLEPIHERAIDLLIAGKRQFEVAKELNISARTLRRWCDEDLFVKELTRQHELARKLEQDEAQQLRRENRQLQRVAMSRVQQHIIEQETPLELRKHCLSLGMRATQFDMSQEWRAFVYFDKKKDKAEKEEAQREDRVAILKASHRLDASASLLENLQKLNPEAFAAALSCSPGVSPGVEQTESAAKIPADRPKADNSGHTPSGPGVPPGQTRMQPPAKPKGTQPTPFITPESERLIQDICADVIEESFGIRSSHPDLHRNQLQVRRQVARSVEIRKRRRSMTREKLAA